MARFLRIDPAISGSNPPSVKLSLRVRNEESRHLFVVAGVRITRCGHNEVEDLDTTR